MRPKPKPTPHFPWIRQNRAQEQLRQPHILKDLHRQAATSHPASQSSRAPSPALAGFAAIRQHAKNTLGLTAPVAPQTSGKKEQDVTMT